MRTLKKGKFTFVAALALFAVISALLCVGAMSANVTKAEESSVAEVFETENGVSAKLSGEGGIRFRVRFDEQTKNNIIENDDIILNIIVAPEHYFAKGVDESEMVKITVDKAKIYDGGDGYFYANGCLTDIKEQNRKLNFKAIAEIVKGGAVTDKTSENDNARNNLYDVLNSAVLDASGSYEQTVFALTAYNTWFGTEKYPLNIRTLDDYNALVAKINGGATEFDGKLAKYAEAFKDNAEAVALESGKTAPKGIYSVTLNGNDAETLNDVTEYIEGTSTTLPVPARTGYDFKGWFETADFSGEAVTEITALDYGDKTFYAKWEILTYAVKFLNADGAVLQNDKVAYGTVPEYSGMPTLTSNKYVYTFKGWNKQLTAVTGEQIYIAAYTKTNKEGETHSCKYNAETETHVFESTRRTGNGEWTVKMSGSCFYQTGGVLLRASNDAFVTLTFNNGEKKVYFIYDTWGVGIGGNVAYANGGGASPVDITFKFVKTADRVIGYVDGVYVGDIYKGENENSDVFFGDDLNYVLETYRNAANTDTLNFEATAVPYDTYAINGAVADTTTAFGVTATGDFAFTASVQGTGLYTQAGIRINCGDDFIDVYSHTYGGNANFLRFDGWKTALSEGKVNIANSDKATYKVIKKGDKMSFYLNDTLLFEFDKDYYLQVDWGNKFFKEGAVFSFGVYTEAGAGGNGYACDIDIDYAA